MDSYWFDIGQFQDYERAMKLHEEGKLLISGQ
jgi:NDP-sugar pyrophosphorylase family protein